MASNVERRWRQLISGADGAQKQPDNNMTEGESRQVVLLNLSEAHFLTPCRLEIQETEAD